MTKATIDPAEATHFGALAADWWNPKGSSAMLHRLNPVRLRYVRDSIDTHWGSARTELRPLAGRRALDVGCGAGLLAEPLARLGAEVTGIDAAPENIGAAEAHAAKAGLAVRYLAGEVEQLSGETFDLITAMEVIEHVTDPAAFVGALARLLAPGGLLIVSTPNRTPVSQLAMISLGEGLGMIPRGTHDWNKFVTPDEVTAHLAAAGLAVEDVTGLSLDPARGFVLGRDVRLNYLLRAVRN
ncbi:bifunctional 2-polyprenyl-6-hydroxyphenol methylase/3-demethylubiquinol 3-O-methyltransferase UbiG [Sphingomonas baiyangensis]|uniref:Ubiquinone biosynthesis O-methyltransferase n=1 Tax=Sphingomonas baiyangensis TaxID=2572576 RepID=A0A4U1L507_9SPHN|nr:bifunctional 2-polyprenyl-6-hydroxyphenol methylase/3-demethylubiquinol 3-O-methyltransferase UbiG [Sphingomonas baiyangensis]TKD51979.1 bifunctional 2-polyprenyl-6-hydroxyphenol methylase/3-demethylubiquinol 3-O-methyltransferase UbiG [Sphingomonas baiyangensis]